MKGNSSVPQHKRMAAGDTNVGFKRGGTVKVPLMKSGRPDTPLEDIKRANGIVGMKKGGRCD